MKSPLGGVPPTTRLRGCEPPPTRRYSLNARIKLLEIESNRVTDVGRIASPTTHTRLHELGRRFHSLPDVGAAFSQSFLVQHST